MTDPWGGSFNTDAYRTAQQKAAVELAQRRVTFGESEVADKLVFEWLAVTHGLIVDLAAPVNYGEGGGNAGAEIVLSRRPKKVIHWFEALMNVDRRYMAQHIEQGLNLVIETATALTESGFDPSESPGHYARLAGKAEGVRQAIASWDPIRVAAEEVRARELAEQAEAQRLREEGIAAREQALVAQEALKSAYTDLADSEARTASRFRLAVMGTLATIGLVSLVLANIRNLSAKDASELLTHLAFTIPAFVLAGYFARESAQHRKMARWAAVLAVQLSTIRSYIGPLEPAQQNELQTYFGRRVLGDLPGDFGGKDEDLTTALSALEKLASELSARRP